MVAVQKIVSAAAKFKAATNSGAAAKVLDNDVIRELQAKLVQGSTKTLKYPLAEMKVSSFFQRLRGATVKIPAGSNINATLSIKQLEVIAQEVSNPKEQAQITKLLETMKAKGINSVSIAAKSTPKSVSASIVTEPPLYSAAANIPRDGGNVTAKLNLNGTKVQADEKSAIDLGKFIDLIG